MNITEKVTLTELQRVIRDKLYEALPGFYWVIAEIAEMKVNTSGHCYLELTDSDSPGGKITARARATIWSTKFRTLNAIFSAATGIPLRQGITILLRATIDYHELYGLSLNISDIDPAYTVGEMALKREAIIRRLTEEGVLEMNRSLSFPLYPRHIAVISSAQAAGYLDFMKHLNNNPFGYVFITELFNAVMQGEETERSVIEALDNVAEEYDKYDAVVLIRGGGSATDLGWFDNYNISFHITQFPLPVLTGIGHEKDLSVADIVSWKALKTPTAVADFIVNTTADTENHVLEMASSVIKIASETISEHREHLRSLENRIAGSARLMLRVKKEMLGYFSETLNRVTHGTIRISKELTERLCRTLTHLDPERILRRGFSLTSRNNIIIRSSKELSDKDVIVTHFYDGKIKSIVSRNENKK